LGAPGSGGPPSVISSSRIEFTFIAPPTFLAFAFFEELTSENYWFRDDISPSSIS